MKILSILILLAVFNLQVGCYNSKKDRNASTKNIVNVKLSEDYKSQKKNLQLIATSETPLYEKNTDRVNNIKLAAGSINNIIIVPGQEFSFNKIVGERTKTKGYREAPILVKTSKGTQKGMGIGGGVCQVSSTVYKSAKIANLEILERHAHSKKVFYTQVGDDATVAYPSTDLRFKNNKKNDIVIKVEVLENKIRVDILENI